MTAATIFPLKIIFNIPISPDRLVERFVYVYVLNGEKLRLLDTGVAGAEQEIATALQPFGKKLSDVGDIILTHAHPDHIGAAALIREQSGAQVWAHSGERHWIEDVDRQVRERPVPGFAKLVAGSVKLDRLLEDGDLLRFADDLTCKVLHTPGHSAGSICLLDESNGILFSGDLIPQPGGMPIYDDVAALAKSLVRIAELPHLTALYSSWDDPLFGSDAVVAIRSGMGYLLRVHGVVTEVFAEANRVDLMELCRQCVQTLRLPPFAANPLVLRSFLAHKRAADKGIDLVAMFAPFVRNCNG